MTAIHFLNQVSDFSGGYAFGVELDNHAFQDIRVLLVVRQRVLMKLTVAVSRHLHFNWSKLGINLAEISTISRIASIPAISGIGIIAQKGSQFSF